MRDLRIDYDLFFIKKDFYKSNKNMLKDVLVLTEYDFFNHYKYGNVNNISNHETWGIDFDYVIIGVEGWFEGLPEIFRENLKEETINNGDALKCGDILLTKKTWKDLDLGLKENFFRDNDDDLVDTNINNIEGFDYLKKFHNVFPNNHGPNCFASVMYSISKKEDLINEWAFADSLLLFLEAKGYEKIDEIKDLNLIKANDVLILYDENPVHAVFCLDDKLCFNKFGQTMHEAWSICKIDYVLGEFNDIDWKIFRNIN